MSKRRVKGLAGWHRREITDKHEKELTRYENEEHVARVQGELATEKTADAKANEMLNQAQPDLDPDGPNWQPPTNRADHLKLVQRSFPNWPLGAQIWQANRNMERFPLMEQAIEDGLKIGNTLREQAHYQHGWKWESLNRLTPSERTQVLAIVRRHVLS